MATTASRKTTARKTSTRKTTARKAPPGSDVAPAGLLVLDDEESQAEIDAIIADREPLFQVGGVTYSIPKKVPPSWTMTAVSLAMERGESVALMFGLENMLGEDGWLALRTCKTLTEEKMAKVIRVIVDRLMPGWSLVPKGLPTSGTNGSPH